MQIFKKKGLFESRFDRLIFFSAIGLAIYGTFMIISAEMGESTADLTIITSTSIKQFASLAISLVALLFCSKFGKIIISLSLKTYWIGYCAMLILLIIPRAFAPAGGAYGWIRLGPASIQPSEFAKVFVILFAAKIFAKNDPKTNYNNFIKFVVAIFVYFVIIVVVEKDFGSALVVFAIGYVCALVAPYQENKAGQNIMLTLMLAVLVLGIILLTPIGTVFLSKFSNHYQILRFLASANPFNYQYDSGYHLIMSLVSFATGGFFGLGYGKSIHKFMNFPNPSTDFILPVIVEEMGLVLGFIPIVLAYSAILIKLARHSYKCRYVRGKIVMLGTFMYFMIHFVLNIGGVSGLIPLTGVPLLLISSGGSSLLSCMMCLGFAEAEIVNYQSINYENNSR